MTQYDDVCVSAEKDEKMKKMDSVFKLTPNISKTPLNLPEKDEIDGMPKNAA